MDSTGRFLKIRNGIADVIEGQMRANVAEPRRCSTVTFLPVEVAAVFISTSLLMETTRWNRRKPGHGKPNQIVALS